MQTNPWVWGVLIVVSGIVVALAVWLGRGFTARFGNKSVEVEARHQPSSITVAKRVELDEVKAGNIAGVRVEGESVLPSLDVDVLGEAKIRKSELGDIVGIEQTNDPKRPSGATGTPSSNANRT